MESWQMEVNNVNQICKRRNVCFNSDSPFANLSSEAPDPALFLSVNWCWGPFTSPGHYPRLCFSDVSQPDALDCARNLCTLPVAGFPFGGFGDPPFSPEDPPPSGSMGGGTQVGPNEAPPDIQPSPVQDPPGSDNWVDPPVTYTFWNTEQTSTACCPDDGPCHTFTAVAGMIVGVNQAQADALAKTFAQQSAAQLCLGDCPDATCLIIDGVTLCGPDMIPTYDPTAPPHNLPPKLAIFWNSPQSCVVVCPDGITQSVFTTPPGKFPGRTLAQANAAAVSYACQQAQLRKVCPPTPPNPCVPAITPAIEAAYAGNFGMSVYANVTGKVWAIDSSSGTSLIEINPSTGAVLHTVPIAATSIFSIFYENQNKTLYIAYSSGGDIWLATINPVTRLVAHAIHSAVIDTFAPTVATFDPTRNKVWFGGSSYVLVLDASAFTINTVTGVPGNWAFSGGLAYASVSDVVVCMGLKLPGGTTAVITVNPGTLGTTVTDINVDNGNTFAAAYCSHNNRVYAPSAPGTKVFVISPSSPNGGTFITVAYQPIAAVYNSCTNRVQVICIAPGNIVKCVYINPDTNAVTATVTTVNTSPFFSDPGTVWFDSDHARVLYGSNTALLKFT